MKASLCLGVAAGVMAFGGLDAANAVVGGSTIAASRPALSEQAEWHKKHHCKWHNHHRHCWWS